MKWQGAFFMPEQIKMLHQAEKEMYQYKQKPVLPEEQLEEMNYVICEAMEFNQALAITHYHHHDFQLLIGYVHHSIKQQLHIVDKFQSIHLIKIKDIVDVRIHS